jgi:hypothetical protein
MKIHGILQNYIIKSYPIGHLKILKGETSKSAITIFKEYIANKLDLKFYVIKDRNTKKIRTRLIHINNGRIVYKRDRGVN